jgi:hypothetical protein
MSNTTFKKYKIGSPKRIPLKKRSILKKYNIGPPRRPSYEMELTDVIPSTIKFSTPKAKNTSEEMKKVTPRTAAWDEWAKKGETGIIYEHEEDDDDISAKQKRVKLGIRSPKEYTGFEKIQTKFMKKAYEKKTPSDIIEQVEEEEWDQKEDDPGGVIEEIEKRGKGSRIRRNGRSRNQRSRRSRNQRTRRSRNQRSRRSRSFSKR